MTDLKTLMRRWRQDEDGSIAVETLMMVPLMVWAFLATIIYFDAYRTEAIAHKASLTIADMLSRETDYIDNDYMNGMRDLLKFLTLHDKTPQLRVTVVRFHDPNEDGVGLYRRVWSKNRGAMGNLTYAQVTEMGAAGKFPIMSHGERLILVETITNYVNRYNVMFVNPLEDFDVDTYTFISPRFAPRLCWTPDADAANAQDVEKC